MGGLTFTQDEKGNWGYKPEGADAVIPFRSAIQKRYLSDKLSSIQAQSIDLSSYADYKKWTVSPFSTEICGTVGVVGGNLGDATFSMSYNSESGILSCTAGRLTHNPGGYFISLGAYYRIVLFS